MIINYNFYDKKNLKINRNNDKGNLIRTTHHRCYCNATSVVSINFRPNHIRTMDSQTKRSRKSTGNARRYLYGMYVLLAKQVRGAL